MELSETAWRCFRNLEPRRQQWRPGLNVFLGPNGSGKTNILESINVLSGWGVLPLPGNRISSMVAWNATEKTAFLRGYAHGERDLEVTAQIGERMSLRVSNERTTYSELRALLPSLSFLPGKDAINLFNLRIHPVRKPWANIGFQCYPCANAFVGQHKGRLLYMEDHGSSLT